MQTSLAPVVDFTRDIWTVSRLNSEVRAVLDGSFPLLWVQGELSNLAQPTSGHIYFTLKDEGAQVRCAMFRPKRRLLAFRPGNGQQVLVRARIGLYEPRGDYQLICEHMEPAGEGALRIELERRKQRLAAEGLFDPAAKRALPAFPRQVGLITSASGAALHDLLTVLGRRLPLLPVLLYPAQVQGDGAAATLIDALELANRRADCDLLILARGGGSLEDLMAFNDEALIRAIRASALPVVTGVGHEVDLSLADLAADVRCATPSAAAETVAPAASELRARLRDSEGRLVAAQAGLRRRLANRLEAGLRHLRLLHPAVRLQQQGQRLDQLERRMTLRLRHRLEGASARLRAGAARLAAAAPDATIRLKRNSVDTAARRLASAMPRQLASRRERLAATAGRLDALSPLATLGRGYSIVTVLPEDQPLRDAEAILAGTRLRIRPAHGELLAVVQQRDDV